MINNLLDRIYACNQEIEDYVVFRLPAPWLAYTNKPIMFAVPGAIQEPSELSNTGYLVRIYEIEINVAVRPIDLNWRETDGLSQAVEETVNVIEAVMDYYHEHRRLSTVADPEDYEPIYADVLIDCDGVIPEFEGPDSETWVGTVFRLSIPLLVNLF